MKTEYGILEVNGYAFVAVKLPHEEKFKVASFSEEHKKAACKLYRKGREFLKEQDIVVYENIDTGEIGSSPKVGDVESNVAVMAGDSVIIENYVAFACRDKEIYQGHVLMYSDGEVIGVIGVGRMQETN